MSANGKIGAAVPLLRLHEDARAVGRAATLEADFAAAAPPPRRWQAATRCAPSAAAMRRRPIHAIWSAVLKRGRPPSDFGVMARGASPPARSPRRCA